MAKFLQMFSNASAGVSEIETRRANECSWFGHEHNCIEKLGFASEKVRTGRS